MSLSSLSAQLASLNAAAANGKNAGSSLGTSKQHDDAVGRGLAHSATRGHTLQTTSPHFKPSVLYADSREASDVPLTTLRENCVSCLYQLSRDTLNDGFVQPEILQTLVGTKSLVFERGLVTRAENDKIDETIISLLSLLSSAMGESAVSCYQSSLHVLEFLVRRYDIHLRANTAESLLLATFPYHEQPVFVRVLQLVDIASLPTWAFLRPHAAKGAQSPNRAIFAKRAARDDALITLCCQMAKNAAQIHADECTMNNAALLSAPRRGISRVISFAVAVLVEALSIQTTIPTNQGSVAEPTLRCVFPFVLNACGRRHGKNSTKASLGVTCPDWRGYGHVMAATISEKAVLAGDVRQVLCTTIVKGALETDDALEENGIVEQAEHVQVAADYLLALMTVLSSNNVENNKDSTLEVIGRTDDKMERRVGYDLDPATFRVLVKQAWLAQALGSLNVEREISVAPFLASILALAIPKLLKEKHSAARKKEASSYFWLISELIQEESLCSVWTSEKYKLTASFVSALMIVFANESDNKNDAQGNSLVRAILDAIRAVDSTGCDAGIANAVSVACSKGGGKGSRSNRKKRVALLLGVPLGSNNKAVKVDGGVSYVEEAALLLPPRVALEHPEASVRLNAIERVMEEVTGMDVEETGEPLEIALLRRVVTEDNVPVAAAAGSALVTLLKAKNSTSLKSDFSYMALDALCKWSVSKEELATISQEFSGEKSQKKNERSKKERVIPDQSPSNKRLEVLDFVLLIASYAVRSLVQEEDNESTDVDGLLSLLIQAVVAHLDFGLEDDKEQNRDSETIVLSASKALQFALSYKRKKSKRNDTCFDTAKAVLQSDFCLSILKKQCSSSSNESIEKPAFLALQRRYLWVMLATLSGNENVPDVLAVSLHILGSYQDGKRGSGISDFEARMLRKRLRECAQITKSKNTEDVPGIIISLSSIPSPNAYEQVCSLAIQDFCRSIVPSEEGSKEGTVSPIAVVMEAASRFNVPKVSVKRLLAVACKFAASETCPSPFGYTCGVVQALLLSGHEDQKVRKYSLGFLSSVAERLDSVEWATEDEFAALRDLCKLCSKEEGSSGMYSSLLMGGESTLSKLVTKALQVSNEPSRLRVSLTRYCLFAAKAHGAASGDGGTEMKIVGWLPFGRARGGCRAAASVLKALEFAGEASYPLSLRWEHAGKQIFREMLRLRFTSEDDARLGITQLQDLVDSVVTMLKGVVVIDAASLDHELSGLQISSGPSQKGRRSRSYSVGKIDGVSFMETYLQDMYEAVVEAISSPFCDTIANDSFARELCDTVIRIVFTPSWGAGIFKKMPHQQRRRIACSLLHLRSSHDITSAGTALFGLPMDASDVLILLGEAKNSSDFLLALTLLCDWIRLNSSSLSHDSGSDKVISVLFENLGSLSLKAHPLSLQMNDVDGAEYARLSILQTLLSLSQESQVDDEVVLSEENQKELATQVSLLVRLVGGGIEKGLEEKSSFLSLASGKAKSISISMLTNLCSRYPSVVEGSLVPALLSTMVCSGPGTSESVRSSHSAGDALMGVVPVFCQHASSAGLSLLNLMTEFILESNRLPDKQERLALYGFFVDALLSVETVNENCHSIGSLLGIFLASEVFRSLLNSDKLSSDEAVSTFETRGDHESREKSDPVTFALDVLYFAPPSEQVASLLQLLRFCNMSFAELGGTMTDVGSIGKASSADATDIGLDDVLAVLFSGLNFANVASRSLNGQYTLMQCNCVMGYVTAMLTVVQEALSTRIVRKFIRSSDDSRSALCLQLWQEMLSIQAAAIDVQATTLQSYSNKDEILFDAKRFFELSIHTIGETLEGLQNLLPAHLFLASAVSLINEDSTGGELRAKAIRLVAERAQEVEPKSAEATLFLDVVPLLVGLLGEKSAEPLTTSEASNALLQQSALIAIEHISRSLCLPSDSQGGFDKDACMFLKAVEAVTILLGEKSSGLQLSGNASVAGNASIQVLCSAALCASTLVRVLKARCLPFLQRIVDPLLDTLATTNGKLLPGSEEIDREMKSTLNVLQLSSLRAIVAVTDTLPQFLLPYLSKLLSPLGLPSRALRLEGREQDIALTTAIEQVEASLSRRTPARQLVPAVCKASSRCKELYEESKVILGILELTVQNATRGELSSLTNWVLKTLILAYEHDGPEGDQILLFSAANKVLLALVFKLSEAQLRALFSKLRDWRGELKESSNVNLDASKRLAFWTLSSVLSRELRSLFLPCLSNVVSDAADELECAVSALSTRKSSKKLDGGKKKRRLDLSSSEGDNLDVLRSLRSLQPVLCCLESALKADAHEGGSWTRANDGQRYSLLLDPLGKLLQCKFPPSFPTVTPSLETPASTTPFEQIIEGVDGEENGNVIGCLTALASAAGNEQLWKPLNHMVLEACDNEVRSEVRKAGVTCLLSLIKALGEEYMVLLPECLPVLSELLEDSDENIVALAQKCVSLGEELLGESLQDSLR